MNSRPECSATTKSGRPCRGCPVRDTDPLLCSAHGGGSRPPGAPPGNRNALKHGAYARQAIPAQRPEHGRGTGSSRDSQGDEPPDLPSRIRDLDKKIRDLSTYIDNLSEKEKKENYAGLLTLYGQLLSRLGRLMRDQRAISGEAADGIPGAIAQALDELSTHLGVDL
jgi:hypothetical protein